MLTQERLREIAWEIGQNYPIPCATDTLVLNMVHPRLGHVHWHLRQESLDRLRAAAGEAGRRAPLAIRFYDVTDVVFDGYNAHRFFDIDVGGLSGSYYFGVDEPGRHRLAEIGIRCGDGAFRAAVRSATVFFDRDRAAGNFQLEGLFVSGGFKRVFPVENIFDAPAYERLNRELAGIAPRGSVSVAMLFVDPWAEADSPLRVLTTQLAERLRRFGGEVTQFATPPAGVQAHDADDPLATLDAAARPIYAALLAAHRERPFELLHAHDWYSAGVGLAAAEALRLPLILSLHSTEHERAQGNLSHPLAAAIVDRERAAVHGAEVVVVPHSATRQQVLSLFGAAGERVVVIPDIVDAGDAGRQGDPGEVKRNFQLNPQAPLVLFAAEVSHAAGADLLMEAATIVCRSHGTVQFAFAGDGPLRGELEARAWHVGLGYRCRFFGDVTQGMFDALLHACDFVVIPARTWQDAAVAQAAIDSGRPVLTTHQAGIRCVVHGQNGLVTYDNPGSIVWGVQELLANPLQASMRRLTAKKRATEAPSLESVTAQHYLLYEILLHRLEGAVRV
ncbi:glycosyltransferase [Candidatus Binatia bacterium]|nr:glycosyltransferase [Candidatus Binatia bacterium]